MTMNSLGDLAQSVMLRQQNLKARQDINRLTQEVSTGITSDVSQRVKGDFRYLADIERNIGLVEAYRTANAEAATLASGMQTALERMQKVTAELAPTLLAASNSGLAAQQTVAASLARDSWEQITSLMNTQFSGRSLFAGTATDQPALADAGTIVAALQAHIAAETSVAGLTGLVDSWFDTPGGGFDTIAYLGSTDGLAAQKVDATTVVELDTRADDPALRNMLKHAAMALIATDSALALPDVTRRALQKSAGQSLMQDQERITDLRAELGLAQNRIEDISVRLASERGSLDLSRYALISVDPFDTASQLATAQTQLESLYAVTARLSRLSLASFLR